MRKDFLVDAYQVLEGRVAGAGGVLAIIRMLPRADLEQLIDAALELHMFVLLEAFDAPDIELAHALVDSRRGQRDAAAGRREFARSRHAQSGAGPARCAGVRTARRT